MILLVDQVRHICRQTLVEMFNARLGTPLLEKQKRDTSKLTEARIQHAMTEFPDFASTLKDLSMQLHKRMKSSPEDGSILGHLLTIFDSEIKVLRARTP